MDRNEIILHRTYPFSSAYVPIRGHRRRRKIPWNDPLKEELQSKDSRVLCSSFNSSAFECCESPHPTHLPTEALQRSWALRNNETLTSVRQAALSHFQQIGSYSSSISCIPPSFDKIQKAIVLRSIDYRVTSARIVLYVTSLKLLDIALNTIGVV